MATFTDRLMGEVIDNPDGKERDVEFLLMSLLRTLVEEQKGLPQEKNLPSEKPDSEVK